MAGLSLIIFVLRNISKDDLAVLAGLNVCASSFASGKDSLTEFLPESV